MAILFKFLMKYGPGSIGHNAKTLAKMYTVLYKDHPDYNKVRLFEELLRLRMSGTYKVLIGKQLNKNEIREMVQDAQKKLSKLILNLAHWERRTLDDLALADAEKYFNVCEVIQEIVKKYAPEGDEN